MKKKFYMQPQTEVTRSFYNDNLMDDFQVSTLGGDGPDVIGQGDDDEGVEPSAPTFNAWEQEL